MPRAATVLVFGTFDLLHPGHVYFLKQVARYGRVTIALTPDELCVYYKEKAAVNPFSARRQRLLRLSSVANVIAADDRPGDFGIVKRVAPDTVIFGYDQHSLMEAFKNRLPELDVVPPRVVTIAPYRTELYQSSRFRAATVVVPSLASTL